MDHLDDQQIIRAVLAGDIDAYGALVKRYERPIFNLMYRLTRSYETSLDLAQETFIKAYQKLNHFREGSRFFPWLYTIGFNHARNFLRKDKVLKSSIAQDCGEETEGNSLWQQEEHSYNQLDFKRLSQALQQLPPDYREAVILHFHEGLSMEEISKALHLSVSGAKMRVHRGVKRLRQMLEQKHEMEKVDSENS